MGKKLKILITNDDGRDAACLPLLLRKLSDVADPIVVAPHDEMSTTGHSLSLHRPLKLEQLSERFYTVNGFPADCVFLGSTLLFADGGPDLVISGINRGGNLGQDIYYSGTAAGAREATFRGIPAIAASLVVEFSHGIFQDKEEEFLGPVHFLCDLIANDIKRLIPTRTFLNINFPYFAEGKGTAKGAQVTVPGYRLYDGVVENVHTPRKKKMYWVGGAYHGFDPIKGSDCQLIDNGFISVTPYSHATHHTYPYGVELNKQLSETWKSVYTELS